MEILGATLANLVTRATRRPEFAGTFSKNKLCCAGTSYKTSCVLQVLFLKTISVLRALSLQNKLCYACTFSKTGSVLQEVSLQYKLCFADTFSKTSSVLHALSLQNNLYSACSLKTGCVLQELSLQVVFCRNFH
jgi:hypothetical protein